jgi:hypothetical protein
MFWGRNRGVENAVSARPIHHAVDIFSVLAFTCKIPTHLPVKLGRPVAYPKRSLENLPYNKNHFSDVPSSGRQEQCSKVNFAEYVYGLEGQEALLHSV